MSGLAEVQTNFPVPPRAKPIHRLIQARSPYLVTHVFSHPYPKGGLKEWCAQAPERKEWGDYTCERIGGSGYLRPDFMFHLVRLREELRTASPVLIVPIGPIALWALTGQSDVSIARGAVSTATLLVPGIKILPIYSMEQIQADWRCFHITVSDLVKAAYESTFLEVKGVKFEIHICPDRRDLALWRSKLLCARKMAVDIETSLSQITCIGFATGEEEAFVVPFVRFDQANHSYWANAEEEADAWQLVRDVLESDIPKVLQNGLYDSYYLARQAGIFIRSYREDTRLQHHALFPELPKSLAFLGATYTNFPPWKQLASYRREKRDA